jgi:hypothetical protein
MTRDLPLTLPPPPPPGSAQWLPPPPPGSPRRRPPPGWTVWAIGAALAVVGVVFPGSFVYFDHPIPGSNCTDWYVYCPIGPSGFAPAGVERAPAESIGCRSSSGEVCYAAIFEATIHGLTLAHLRFVVANSSPGGDTNGPIAPPLPLGASAQVTALASPGSVAGIWNFSDEQWVSGSDWAVRSTSGVTVILDTGLVSNTTLTDAEFDIVLTSPYEGSVGFPLSCAGC